MVSPERSARCAVRDIWPPGADRFRWSAVLTGGKGADVVFDPVDGDAIDLALRAVTAHHGMALSENGQRDAARPKIDRSLAQNPHNPWAAHARAHLCYEEGDANAARAFLASWLTTHPRNGLLYSHLSWHLALGDLEAGDAATGFRLFREAFSPDVHSGPPGGKVNDAVSFLWRWELAGHPRDAEAWRVMHDFATSAFPRAGAAFSDMHIVLTQAVAGKEAALEARARPVDDLVAKGRDPSGPCVSAVSRAFAHLA
jgi:hypothetical protein